MTRQDCLHDPHPALTHINGKPIANYRLRLAIIGNIDAGLANSQALRSFVHETNRGTDCWFLDTMEELETRLSAFSTPA